MDKRALSERDICAKFITPALRQAKWDKMLQIRDEVGLAKAEADTRILVDRLLREAGYAR